MSKLNNKPAEKADEQTDFASVFKACFNAERSELNIVSAWKDIVVDVNPIPLARAIGTAMVTVASSTHDGALMLEQSGLTATDIGCYIFNLINHRVEQVLGSASNHHRWQRLLVPSVVQLLIQNLGVVADKELGIRISPRMASIKTVELSEAVNDSAIMKNLSIEEMEELSLKLSRMTRFKLVDYAYPRGADGNADVMLSIKFRNNDSRHSNKGRDVTGVYMAALLGLVLGEDSTNPKCSEVSVGLRWLLNRTVCEDRVVWYSIVGNLWRIL